MTEIPITVFGKPNCVQCTQTVKKFERSGLEAGRDFIYRDVTQDPAAYEYITAELGYSAAPVVVLDDQDHWSGFRPDDIKRGIAWALQAREQTVTQPEIETQTPALAVAAGVGTAGPEPPTVSTPTPGVIDLAARRATSPTTTASLSDRMAAVTRLTTTEPAPQSHLAQPQPTQPAVGGMHA